MKVPVQLEPAIAAPPDIDYRWDPDTDILSVRVRAAEGTFPLISMVAEPQAVDAVEVEGRDGSWIVLDLEGGHLAGIEVAVWPNVRKRAALPLPSNIEDARVRVSRRRPSASGAGPFEVTTRLTAESDEAERTIHFRLGPSRSAKSVRLGRDLLVDVDAEGHLAGVWLLNVPPVPTIT